VSNIGALNFIKHRDPNIVIVGDFNTPLSPIGHPDQKNQERNFRIE
jgi:hypothetical protein